MTQGLSDDEVYQLLVESQEVKRRCVCFPCNDGDYVFSRAGEIFYSRPLNIEISDLSCTLDWVGEKVSVIIFRNDERNDWRLDLLMQNGLSMTWRETFATEKDAIEALKDVMREIQFESLGSGLIANR